MKQNGHYSNGHEAVAPSLGAKNGTLSAERHLSHHYDREFLVTPAYKESLPDLQNGPSSLIKGARVAIQQVGIHNFRLPLRFTTRDGEILMLETAVTGTVSLEAHKKGINMSRILRTFYEYQDKVFSLDQLENILHDYRDNLESRAAHLMLRLNYPIKNDSLRSGLSGWQYYTVALEARIDAAGTVQKFMHLDFVYSSTCPCSYELAQHAIETRGVAAVPHSQRSVARISVELRDVMCLEALRDLCLAALHTETQVMVKREDEQAFAELNAAHLKFVEDAARLLYEQLEGDERICDFKIIASHQESLHSHDAISVIVKGMDGGFTADIEPNTLTTLIHGR